MPWRPVRVFDQGMTRLIYTRYFLNSLLPKARAIPQFQTALSRQNCKTLGDFDDRFTAPLHGFADRHDYYRRNSCKPFLKGVDTPLLLLNAVNDPFLPPEACRPGGMCPRPLRCCNRHTAVMSASLAAIGAV